MTEADQSSILLVLWNAALSLILALFGIITTLRSREQDAIKKMAENAHRDALKAQSDLAAHKLHAAENFATKAQIESLDQKIDNRFDKIDAKVDDLDDKLDDIKDRLPRNEQRH